MEFVADIEKRGKLIGCRIPKGVVDALGIKENTMLKLEIEKSGSKIHVLDIRIVR